MGTREDEMETDQWRAKLDSYLDGELPPAEASALALHLQTCSGCTAEALHRAQVKLTVRIAGKRYQPSAQLRSKVSGGIAAKAHPGISGISRRHFGWQWRLAPLGALALLFAVVAVNSYVGREQAAQKRVYSELADLHVATLASATPVDVLSTDRHTVKPWFQGKIPFTFNLPELQGSEFTLLGGRVAYLEQMPGAQLIYQIRKHNISVFIFPDRGAEASRLPSEMGSELSFHVESWTQNGLRYFAIGDVNGDDIRALSKLLRNAG
jgi:anti-sigma factor RsiW